MTRVGLLEVRQPQRRRAGRGPGRAPRTPPAPRRARSSSPRRARCARRWSSWPTAGTQATPGRRSVVPSRRGSRSPSTGRGRGARRTDPASLAAARPAPAARSTCPRRSGRPGRAPARPGPANHWSRTATVVRVEPSSRRTTRLHGDVRGVEGDDVGARRGGSKTPAGSRGVRVGDARHPDALRRKGLAVARPGPSRGSPSAAIRPAVRRARPAGRRSRATDRAGAPRRPSSGAGRRRPRSTLARTDAALSGSSIAVGSSSSSSGGLERQRTREGQPLLLPPGQGVGRGVLRHVQARRRPAPRRPARACPRAAHRCSRGRRRRPGRRSPRRCRRPAPAGRGRRRRPGTRARRRRAARCRRPLAGVRDLEHPGQRPQQRRLAGAARTDEQHPLPRRDVEVEAGDDRVAPTVRAPPQLTDSTRPSRCRPRRGRSRRVTDPARRSRVVLRQRATPVLPARRGRPPARRPREGLGQQPATRAGDDGARDGEDRRRRRTSSRAPSPWSS